MTDTGETAIKTVVRQTAAMTGTGDGGTTFIGIAGNDTSAATSVIGKPWWFMLLVRVARVYLQTFIGLWAAAGSGVVEIKLSFAQQWGVIATVLLAALAPSFITLLMNAVEFLTNLDQTRPGMRA